MHTLNYGTSCPVVNVLVGLPASGKSTWAKEESELNGSVILSSDSIREELFGSEEEQGSPKLVFDTLKERLVETIRCGRNVIVDATSINRWERSDYINIANNNGAIAIATLFNTPLEACKIRNEKRERTVPDFVYDRMTAKYEEPSTEEGFSAVFYA